MIILVDTRDGTIQISTNPSEEMEERDTEEVSDKYRIGFQPNPQDDNEEDEDEEELLEALAAAALAAAAASSSAFCLAAAAAFAASCFRLISSSISF